jgi:AraC-like DNA-binding protein
LRIEELAKSLGVSRQSLGAAFRQRVGLPAKVFARVCRFRQAHEQIRSARQGECDWAGLALAAGYYDQSHLIHEFRELSGSTPEMFLLARA